MERKILPREARAHQRQKDRDGPTNGTTRMPASCASATSAAPGSAMAGQPASEINPTSWPESRGASKSGNVFPGVCSFSSWMAICCSGVSVGKAFRKARADLAFSATNRVSRRAVAY